MAASVRTDVVVPCRADRARTRLDAVLGGSDGHRATICVGPRRRRWPTKRVRAELTDIRDAGRTSVSDLRWAATGRMHRFFPTLDAGVAVTAIDDTSCLLTIAGGYQPPLGRFGRFADRTLLHRLAESTATDFADRLARALAHDARLVDTGEGQP